MKSKDELNKETADKAIRLYQYLRHLIKLRTSVVYDVSQSNQYIDIIWLNDLPHEEGCYCAAWNLPKEDTDPIWVDIKRPVSPKIPLVPKECYDWIDLKTLENYKEEPALRDKIIKKPNHTNKDRIPQPDLLNNNQEQEIEYLELSNFPEVRSAWDEYLKSQWKGWAKEYGRIKQLLDIYSGLFNMYQQQKVLGESYEVVIGLGLLSCKVKEGGSVFRHILSAQTELDFEPNKGTITIRANAEGAKLQFETDMLNPSEQPPVEIQLSLEERLKEVGDEIWDKSLLQPIIKSWIHSISSNAVYDESLAPPPKDTAVDHPEATFAPAIILRRRTNMGIIRFIEKIISQLSTGVDIPSSIKTFLSIDQASQEPQDNEVGLTEGARGNVLAMPEEIYFPLSYNDEQFRIIREIKGRKGVLVQGPPGTGKSHTIANLISHFLASGQKVLVTSQTARALKVLKEKIPQQLQSLCVSILGNRQEDFDNLRSAVQDITSKFYSWDKDSNDKAIKARESDLLTLRKKFTDIKLSLREMREKETYKHSIVDGRFNGTAEFIAQQLKQTENRYGWISDEITSDTPPPLTQNEFKELLGLHCGFNKEYRKELALKRPQLSDLFSPEEFVEMVEKEQRYKQREQEIQGDIKLRILYDKLKKTDAIKRTGLLSSLRVLEKARDEAVRRPLPWLGEAVSSILGDQDQPLKDLASVTIKYLKDLKENASKADDSDITIPRELDKLKVKADAEELLEHLSNRKGLGWGIFRPKIYKKVKYILENIRVNGKLCENQNCLKLLINLINVESTLRKLKEAWKDRIDISAGAYFAQASIVYEQLEALEVVISLEMPLQESKKAVRELEIISEPAWHDAKEIERLAIVLEASLIIDRMDEIEKKVSKGRVLLKATGSDPECDPLNKELLDSLESRDWNKWGNAYNRLIALEQSQKSLNYCIDLLKRLKEKAPMLAELICENPHDDTIEGCADSFEEAWNWLRADAWLREFEEKHDDYQLQRDYEDCESKIKKLLAELASAKSWQHCFNVMTEEQRQHLMAWSKAIQRIGKGTGKRAEKHRKDAEEHMNQCRGAIPAWVMPLYRVVESIDPMPEIFDVVIVDEASQCGPEALFLLYIAKKCIIVGDDQQISPEGVGIERKEVDLLIERFLKDIPHPDSYALESSLFTHAEIRYGARIVLKEHFRCVPEIIEFSNQLCYIPLGAGLIPLRSCPPLRLEPICVKHVSDGYREGQGQNVINKSEAHAIVEQIAICCGEKRYANKTMGVISLQGNTQSRYIEKLLVEKIGPNEIEKRHLICGDAYDFQGDERDVMFLSMVAATNERIGPLVRETDKRRFNVAVSRARDQIWLFHSATINDLSPSDYRHRLLAYCLDPKAQKAEISEDVFDSKFEKDVYEKIVAHGYKVIPQFEVAGYSIDLVVEGLKTRLAIECDGDAWHGPEQYENDQWRQRILERAGWRFWRIRGSIFYRDPEQALEPLWQVLEEIKIFSPAKSEETDARVKAVEVLEITDKEPSIPESKESYEEGGRLTEALRYSESREIETYGAKNRDIQDAVLGLLREGSQGKDLIADKVLRKLELTSRGRNRDRLRRKVLRLITDMKRQGLIEAYETDKRIRFKLSSNQQTLF